MTRCKACDKELPVTQSLDEDLCNTCLGIALGYVDDHEPTDMEMEDLRDAEVDWLIGDYTAKGGDA